MSSASALMPIGSGAPNDSRGFGGSPGPGIAGSPDASTAALHASATSRCASGSASGPRPTNSRQRCRGSRATGGGDAGSGSTSASLRHDERARPARIGRRRGIRIQRLGGLAAAPAVRREAARRTAAVRPGVATRHGPAGRRHRRRPPALDGPRQRAAVHRRPPARLPARHPRPLAGSSGPSPDRRDHPRVHRRPRHLHRVHGADADARSSTRSCGSSRTSPSSPSRSTRGSRT